MIKEADNEVNKLITKDKAHPKVIILKETALRVKLSPSHVQ